MEFTNVKSFAEHSADLCEAIKAYANECVNERKGVKAFAEHSKEEMGKLVNKAFAQELVKQSGFALEDGMDKTAIKRYSLNPQVKYFANEIRDVMVDAIMPIVLSNSSLRYITDIKYADLGDTIKFDLESDGLFTVSKAGNRKRHYPIQKTFRASVTLTGDNHEIAVGTTLYEVLTNQSYIAEDVMRMAYSMEYAMLSDGYDAFISAVGTIPSELTTAGFNEKAIINICEKVSAYNGGRKAVIMGTPTALKNVLPSNANYRYLLDSEYVKLGHLQQFNGFDVLPMENVADPFGATDYAMKFDDTKLYIVSPASDKLIKLGVFGGTITHTDAPYDNANKSIDTVSEKAWNTIFASGSIMGSVTGLS